MNFFEVYKLLKEGKVMKGTWPSTAVGIIKLKNNKLFALNQHEEWIIASWATNDLLRPDIDWQIYKEQKCDCGDHPGYIKRPHEAGIAGCVQFICPTHGVNWFEKESKGLWEAGNKEMCNNFTLVIKPHFNKRNECEEWLKALDTFMRLKGHHLAVKTLDDCARFFIRVAYDYNDLFIDNYDNRDNQITEVSPAFTTHEDAEQAISDIGKENLLHMFKTFSGIYE